MSHPQAATEFLKDQAKAKWHDETLWFVRDKRDKISKSVPEWENLRELASHIKDNVLANLGSYLEEFEKNAKANNIHVHWAKDAEEHNRIVLGILQEKRCKAIVKGFGLRNDPVLAPLDRVEHQRRFRHVELDRHHPRQRQQDHRQQLERRQDGRPVRYQPDCHHQPEWQWQRRQPDPER